VSLWCARGGGSLKRRVKSQSCLRRTTQRHGAVLSSRFAGQFFAKLEMVAGTLPVQRGDDSPAFTPAFSAANRNWKVAKRIPSPSGRDENVPSGQPEIFSVNAQPWLPPAEKSIVGSSIIEGMSGIPACGKRKFRAWRHQFFMVCRRSWDLTKSSADGLRAPVAPYRELMLRPEGI